MTLTTTPIQSTTAQTPDGPFTIIADESSVLASGWTQDTRALVHLVHPSLHADTAALSPDDDGRGAVHSRTNGSPSPLEADEVLARAEQAVRDYYDGDHTAVTSVPVRQVSGPFRQHAWEILRQVSPGAPLTYAEYAARAGRPGAVRAAAGACALNAAALFVPCHRIVRTDGTMGGFRYGVDIKKSLLAREAAAPSSP